MSRIGKPIMHNMLKKNPKECLKLCPMPHLNSHNNNNGRSWGKKTPKPQPNFQVIL